MASTQTAVASVAAESLPQAYGTGTASVSASSPSRGRHLCPECGEVFQPIAGQARQLFCTPAHKQAFQQRARIRGRALLPLQMAARITRGGSRGNASVGIRARQDAEQLIDRWVAEDREAGRMSAVDYIALRLRKGYTLA